MIDEKFEKNIFLESMEIHTGRTLLSRILNNSKDDASAACNDYLKALGFVSIAHSWIKVLEICFDDFDNNKSFYEDKIQTAKFYFKRVLPRAENHFKTATTGSDYIMNFKFN